jgi:hypothetical protein
VLLLTVALCPGPSRAQEEEEDPELPINFVFATQLGTGIYSVGGSTVQVYRIPISHTIRKLENHPWGLKLTFPLTLGLADFDFGDILEIDLPDSVQTISLVPGVELQFPVGKHWVVRPYGEVGGGMHLSGGQFTWVAAAGLRSEGIIPREQFTYRMTGEATYAGQLGSKDGEGQTFGVIRAGFEAQHPLWFSMGGGEKATGGLYARGFFYFDQLRFARIYKDPIDLETQWEVGVTLGRPMPFKWWWVKIKHPRFGLGYRWGRDFWAVRLVLGSAI